MQSDIFNLLLLILMMQNGSGTECVNQLILMFLMMQSRNGGLGSNDDSPSRCGRDDDFTF